MDARIEIINKNKVDCFDVNAVLKSMEEYANLKLKEADSKAVRFAIWCCKNDWKYIQAEKNKWGKYLGSNRKKEHAFEWKTGQQLLKEFEIFEQENK